MWVSIKGQGTRWVKIGQNLEMTKILVSLNKEVVCMSVCSNTNISFNC